MQQYYLRKCHEWLAVLTATTNANNILDTLEVQDTILCHSTHYWNSDIIYYVDVVFIYHSFLIIIFCMFIHIYTIILTWGSNENKHWKDVTIHVEDMFIVWSSLR